MWYCRLASSRMCGAGVFHAKLTEHCNRHGRPRHTPAWSAPKRERSSPWPGCSPWSSGPSGPTRCTSAGPRPRCRRPPPPPLLPLFGYWSPLPPCCINQYNDTVYYLLYYAIIDYIILYYLYDMPFDKQQHVLPPPLGARSGPRRVGGAPASRSPWGDSAKRQSFGRVLLGVSQNGGSPGEALFKDVQGELQRPFLDISYNGCYDLTIIRARIGIPRPALAKRYVLNSYSRHKWPPRVCLCSGPERGSRLSLASMHTANIWGGDTPVLWVAPGRGSEAPCAPPGLAPPASAHLAGPAVHDLAERQQLHGPRLGGSRDPMARPYDCFLTHVGKLDLRALQASDAT